MHRHTSPYLTRVEFETAARYFASRTADTEAPWQYVSVSTPYGSMDYLTYQQTCYQPPKHASIIDTTILVDQEEEVDDEATLPTDPVQTTCWYRCEYHIVYSPVWRLPVLYLRGWHADGTPLDAADLMQLAPDHLRGALAASAHLTPNIAAGEHPVLNQPWFHVHPCRTAEVLSLWMSDMERLPLENYLACWLSLIGPTVGLYPKSTLLISRA
jgi:ubiquitin-like-conjugating enzyme ATG10